MKKDGIFRLVFLMVGVFFGRENSFKKVSGPNSSASLKADFKTILFSKRSGIRRMITQYESRAK